MIRVTLTSMVFLALATSAFTRTLQRVLIINGACTQFEYDTNDLTKFCQDKVSVNLFDDGRTSFTFILKRVGSPDVINTFTGQMNQQVANKQGVSVEPIDGVIYSFGQDAPKTLKAVGFCKIGNLYKPKSFIECTLESGAGRFDVRFEGDASAPVTVNPK